MRQTGQVSFEALIILLVVISSAIFITTLYLQTHDITVATAICRNDLLQQINSFEGQTTLESIRVTVNAAKVATINVKTTPDNIDINNFKNSKIQETISKIKSNTSFSDVEITIN
ncbi:MAG: hypothetical protein NTZ73_04240 [Candidatus Diapherotrites archaeon]|nr:hypothetical protein [Candidatus Diapherotrites archaeon]